MIRRAVADDIDFLVELYAHPEVRPYLAAGADFSRRTIAAEVERSEREPDAYGRFVIEADGGPAGAMVFERVNRRSAIGHLGGLAVHPDFRGRRLADDAARELVRHLIFDLGLHRLELVVYGFNARAAAHAERAGFVREGVMRRAYRHGDGWVDGILYAITREDLEER